MKRGGMHRCFLGSRKAVSALIAVVLLLLITFSAVGVIWGGVLPMITSAMQSGQACINARVNINSISGFTCYDETNKRLNVMVNRGAEEFNLSGVQIGLTSPGSTKVYSFYDDSSVVLHMPFEEGSGTFANDLSGKNNNGTISGANWTQGKIGKALSFDGKDDYINVSNSNSISFVDKSFTLESWIYPYSEGSASKMFICKGPYTVSYCLNLYNDGSFYVYSDSGLTVISGATPTRFKEWNHIAAVWDATTKYVSLYINGQLSLVGSDGNGWNMTRGDLTIGTVGYPYNGTIDEVKIYNRALSADEIKREYERGNEGKQVIYAKIPSKNEANTYVISAANITAVSAAPIVQVGRREKICGITAKFDKIPKCVA